MNLQDVELNSGDWESIRMPGSIQPHGLLLVVDSTSGRVIHAAGDVEGRVGIVDWQGAPLEYLLGADAASAIFQSRTILPRHVNAPHAKEPFDLSVSTGVGVYLVELEPAASSQQMAMLSPKLEEAADAFDKATDMLGLMAAAAREFRLLTGYDRAMVYRVLDDDVGKLVAADATSDQHSLMDHQVPATYISGQVLVCQTRNLVQVIPDVGYQPAPLRPTRAVHNPLDVSDCSLRSVPSIHIQYLKDMGVAASASVSIMKDGVLWGLIICHNSEPRGLTLDVRGTCRALSAALARQIKLREDHDAYYERVRLRTEAGRIVELLLQDESLDSALSRRLPNLQELFSADGIAVCRRNEIVTAGRCPKEVAIGFLFDWLSTDPPRPVFPLNELSESYDPPDEMGPLPARLLVMILSASEPWLVFWFRTDEVEIVESTDEPHEITKTDINGVAIQRARFHAQSQAVMGKARRWSVDEIETAERLAATIQNAWQTRKINDLTDKLSNLANQKDALVRKVAYLLGEVNHRVQSSLTIVSSFLSMQGRESSDEATREAIEEACRQTSAVALVHRRLYGSDLGEMVDGARYVDKLLDDLVASAGEAWQANVTRELKPMLFFNDRIIGVGLALNELFRNATKYAYSGAPGPLHVALVKSGNTFHLTVADKGSGWEATRTGLRSRFLEALLFHLGGRLEVDDNNPGTRAILSAPVAITYGGGGKAEF